MEKIPVVCDKRLMSLTYKQVLKKIKKSYKLVWGGGNKQNKQTLKGTDQTQIANKHTKMFKFPNNK